LCYYLNLPQHESFPILIFEMLFDFVITLFETVITNVAFLGQSDNFRQKLLRTDINSCLRLCKRSKYGKVS